MAVVSELGAFMARQASGQRYSTAVQQINNPIYQGKPNPADGKFYFVGSIPVSCYDQARNGGRGGSKLYDTEDAAIRAAIDGGATYIQGADCRKIDIEAYLAGSAA